MRSIALLLQQYECTYFTLYQCLALVRRCIPSLPFTAVFPFDPRHLLGEQAHVILCYKWRFMHQRDEIL